MRTIMTLSLIMAWSVSSYAASWVPVTEAPAGAGTMILLTDGTVMVHTSPGKDWMRLSPSAAGTYEDGTWSAQASMSGPRLYYASNMLRDGRVFLVGGEYSGDPLQQNFTNTGEIYEPLSNTWSPTADYPEFFFGDDPTILLDGDKILAGSITTSATNIYDVATNTWSPGPPKVYNDRSDEETWVKLADGRILTYDLFQSIATNGEYAEVYDPKTNTWSSISPSDGTAGGSIPQLSSALLGDETGPGFRILKMRLKHHDAGGDVFLAGATGHTAIYSPEHNSWRAGPDIVADLSGASTLFGADDSAGAELPSGHIIFAADAGPASGTFSPPTKLFDYDPGKNNLSLLMNLPSELDAHLTSIPAFRTRMLILPTGQILYGDEGSRTLWIYTGDGTAPNKLRPKIEDVQYNGSGVFNLTGRQLNGQSAGSSFGDDVESDENYPIVHFMNLAGEVFYARTFDWSNTDIGKTGSQRVNFTLNPGMPADTYSLAVSGAGISSKPVCIEISTPEVQGSPMVVGHKVDNDNRCGELDAASQDAN